MAVKDVTSREWILALFERDDGERILLGDGAYDFKESQHHFSANTMDNDVVEIQGNDGYLLAGQVRRPSVQSFDGYIGDATVHRAEIEQLRRAFLAFFAKNHFYRVIYVFPDGSAIQRKRGFIVDPPEVEELFQIYPAYHVALNFEDVNYYEYNEDAEGNEIFGKSAIVATSSIAGGGIIWDSIGAEWDAIGMVWEEGGAGDVVVNVGSVEPVFPVWVVRGRTVDPVFENITTGQTLRYNGTITESQELRIDMGSQTATLNGANVLRNIEGDWVSMNPGANRITYSADNADAPDSSIEWQEIVG